VSRNPFHHAATVAAWLNRQPAGTFTVAVTVWTLAALALGRASVAPQVVFSERLRVERESYPVVVTRYQCGDRILPLEPITKK
jgi:hypothetical protein